MKLNRILLLICIAILTQSAYCQNFALDKGAFFVSGMGSFTNQGGDLFEDSGDNRLTTVSLIPSTNYFITKNFFIGAGLEFASQSQDDKSISTIGIGPQIGYAIGNENSTAYPYLNAGIRYYRMDMEYGGYDFLGNNELAISGIDTFLGVGVLVPIKKHFGFVIEGSYHVTSLKENGTSESLLGNTFSFSFGFVGFIF